MVEFGLVNSVDFMGFFTSKEPKGQLNGELGKDLAI